MKNISLILLTAIALYIGGTTLSCNTQTTNTSTQDTATNNIVSGEERVASQQVPASQREITSLLYTQLNAQTQYRNTPNVKKPMDTFWFNIQTNYNLPTIFYPETGGKVSQLYLIEESIEKMMEDINNNLPASKHFSWDYQTPTGTLVGQYLYVEDRNKIIIPQLQKDLDAIYAKLCTEFGFYVASNQKNITGYYEKVSIKKKVATP